MDSAPGATIEAGPLLLRASVQVADADRRTVNVVWSTGAPVMRYDWTTGERYLETLSLKAKDIRLERLNGGAAPLLNAHDSASLEDVIGVVEAGSVRVANGEGRALVRFVTDDPAADAIWNKVRQGVVRNMSVGYVVHAYEETKASEKGPMRRHAVDWEPYEISAVPIGADAGAQIRKAAGPMHQCRILTATKEVPGMDERTEQPVPLPPVAVVDTPNGGRAVVDNTHPGAGLLPHPVDPPAELDERERALAGERHRTSGIMDACAAVGFSLSYARELIDSAMTLEAAQTAVLKRYRDLVAGPNGPRNGREPGPGDRPGVPRSLVEVRDAGIDPSYWTAIRDALLARVMPESFKAAGQAREFAGLPLLEVARLCLHARRIQTTGMSRLELASLALGLRGPSGYHTTSDFADILVDVANKTLRAAYAEAPQTYTAISRRRNLQDFKAVSRIQVSDAPALLKVPEHGEFKRGTITSGKETYQLATYGRVFAITRQALINDDTDAFSGITVMFGRSARRLESDLVWAEITSNPNMSDGVPLFHATHGNLAATGSVISVASIGAGRAAIRMQKGLDGTTYLNLTPRYLGVPVAIEGAALVFLAPITPTTSTAANPYSGTLQVVAEPRLDANSTTAWYLFVSPDENPVIEYGSLEGEEGPAMETRVGFDIDGLEVKCRHDFAAKVLDWRGVYKNPGAAPS